MSDDSHRSFVCKNCGASMLYAPGMQSLKCEFCGTVLQLTADFERVPDIDEAELIVPMTVDRLDLELATYELMAKGEYTPDDMIEAARFVKFERFYAPFYRFAGTYDGTWTASFGYDRSESFTEWVSDGQGGRRPETRHRTVVDWRPVSGTVSGEFDLAGYAGSKLPDSVARAIENKTQLEETTTDVTSYSVGIEVEAYQRTFRDVFSEGVEVRVNAVVNADVKSNRQGDHQKDWNWDFVPYLPEPSAVLLPICRVIFEYDGQEFNVWSDGADIRRLVVDSFPEDKERKSEVAAGFLPFWTSSVIGALSATALYRNATTPPGVYWGIIGAVALALAYGILRRASLLNYSRRLREAVLTFQKASATNTHLLTEEAQQALSSSFQKPERAWLSRKGKGTSAALSTIAVGAVLLLATRGLLSSVPVNNFEAALDSVPSHNQLPSRTSDASVPPETVPPDSTSPSGSPSNVQSSNPVVVSATPTLSATSAPGAILSAEQKTLQFVSRYWDLSNNRNLSMDELGSLYKQKILYFGTVKDREEVLAEKNAFFKRWPTRRYTMDDGVTVSCDDGRMCLASGNFHWEMSSEERNVMSVGTATFSMTIDWSSGDALINSEKSTVASRQIVKLHDENSFAASVVDTAGTSCDEMAANPNDRDRTPGVSGVRFEDLRAQADRATEICRQAMVASPGESKYKYQYARALSFLDPEASATLLRQLIQQGYSAAYDNLGSLIITQRGNTSEAAKLFIAGAKAGDPDSMVSLADLIDKGYVQVANPAEARLSLLSRAAQLGHQSAQLALQQQPLGFPQQRRQLSNEEQQQHMFNLFGGLLRGIGR